MVTGVSKTFEWWGAGMVICLERGADLHMAQLMPLRPTVSCFSKIQIGFTFLVPVHLGSPGKGPLNVCQLTWTQTKTSRTLLFIVTNEQMLPIILPQDMPPRWERSNRLPTDKVRRREKILFVNLSLCSRSLAVLPTVALTRDAAGD